MPRASLETAEDESAKGLAETRAIEQQAQSEYEKLMQDNKLLELTEETEIKGKQSELNSIKETLTDLPEGGSHG